MPKSSKSQSNHSNKQDKPHEREKKVRAKPQGSPEYLDYLERYQEFGEGRKRLSAAEFDKLDDELLELLDLSAQGQQLSDDQIIRIEELEYLLIDSE